MPYKKPEIEKIYYSIGEVSRRTGVSTSSIRYWEKKFDELSPHKNTKGTRFFNENDIETVKLINHLVRERGITIKGTQQKLKDNREETINTWKIVKKLQNIKKNLSDIRDEMEEQHEDQ